jgi:hypothetical protein
MFPPNINKEIADTANVYENNVTGLQNKAKQDQKTGGLPEALVELLALSEVKKKTDAAKRQIQLDMAQAKGQPTSIAEKLKKGVIDQAISDKVKGVAGVLQKQAKDRNKYMNNLVNKGAKNATQFARPTLPFVQQKPGPKVGSRRIPQQMTQQMPTQYAAMGGGIARMPRQNLTNMADGGIVGFKEGTDSNWLSNIAEKFSMPTSTTLDLLVDNLSQLPGDLKEKVISLANKVKNKTNEVKTNTSESVKNRSDKVNQTVSDLFGRGKNLVSSGIETGKDLISSGIETGKGIAPKVIPAIKNFANREVEGAKDFIFGGEYSSPDPAVLGGGNQNVNAAANQGLANLRSDLSGAKQNIDDLQGGIANADKRIAQNEALSDRFFGESYDAENYLEGFDGVKKLIPGTEQDLVDRNTAIMNYGDKQYKAARNARRKFIEDKKQFEGELGGAEEAYRDTASEVMFMQDMARKARMGDPEAIAYMNQQGKANIQQGLAGIYGNQDVNPSMMKMVEAQQFPSMQRNVDADAIQAAAESDFIPQSTKYPTTSLANRANNLFSGIASNFSDFDGRREELVLNSAKKQLLQLNPDLSEPALTEQAEQLIKNKEALAEEEKAQLTKDGGIAPFTDYSDIAGYVDKGLNFLMGKGGEENTGGEATEIDTSKQMKVIDEGGRDSDTFDAMGQVGKYADTDEGGGGKGDGNKVANAVVQTANSSDFNIGSMKDVMEFYDIMEQRAADKSRKDAILYALANLSGFKGFREFIPLFEQYTNAQKAKARELADKALNYGLQKQKMALQGQANALRMQMMRDNRLLNNNRLVSKEMNDLIPVLAMAREQLNSMNIPGYRGNYGQLVQELTELRSKGSEQPEDEQKLLKYKEIAETTTPLGQQVFMLETQIETFESMIKPLPPMQ